jgi:uncharacterized protein involved in tolerance to divalent cations
VNALHMEKTNEIALYTKNNNENVHSIWKILMRMHLYKKY